jgi:hypothetical protein
LACLRAPGFAAVGGFRPKIHPVNAAVGERPLARQAGPGSRIDYRARKMAITESTLGIPKRNTLGMCIGIAVGHHPARSVSDNRIIHHYNGTKWLIAACDGLLFHACGFRNKPLLLGVKCIGWPNRRKKSGETAHCQNRKVAAIKLRHVYSVVWFPNTDILTFNGQLRYTPESGHLGVRSNRSAMGQKRTWPNLFDHFIDAGEHARRQSQAERIGRLAVD